jgi:hypothetical protein
MRGRVAVPARLDDAGLNIVCDLFGGLIEVAGLGCAVDSLRSTGGMRRYPSGIGLSRARIGGRDAVM